MRSVPPETLEERLARLELVHRVGNALATEKNRDRLVEMILVEAQRLCNADGGTLYLRTDDDRLRFAILRTDSLGVALGGSTGKPIELPSIPMFDPVTGEPNRRNVASAAAVLGRSFNVPDAYQAVGFDFSGTKQFDSRNGYRSVSFLTIPMVNTEDRVIAVLQLLNARDAETSEIVEFSFEKQRTVEALAAQAGIALDNQLLLDGQRELLESFIRMIAAAIDAKSPYTGGHCERVPALAELLVDSLCAAESGPFAEFRLGEDERYELTIAAWLHDCGKVTTPVHVMDKATKLETISDRIEVVRARFESLDRDARVRSLERVLAGELTREAADAEYAREVAGLRDDLAFVERANVGAEFLPPEAKARLAEIGRRRWVEGGVERELLGSVELENLMVSRGTLTEAERIVINGHMVHTLRMLEALPFPRTLKRVPEYAAGHHERMDGTGYPRGVFAGDMSVPARAMAIADVFEALTAGDRPYKTGKKLSEAMRIMGFMKRDNHLDPDLFDHFVQSGVYRRYAERYLAAELIDEVDEAALLAITPRAFEVPPVEERERRRRELLPEYRFPVRDSGPPPARGA
ncbi:MAG: GAF domain-containing protein [Polyangiaceae bacterium]|nr:GAF domain-containing protein [Polyangiaceae bacterium]